MKKRIVVVLAIATLWSDQSLAQSATTISNTELSVDAGRFTESRDRKGGRPTRRSQRSKTTSMALAAAAAFNAA
jgi:hypothetical protein